MNWNIENRKPHARQKNYMLSFKFLFLYPLEKHERFSCYTVVSLSIYELFDFILLAVNVYFKILHINLYLNYMHWRKFYIFETSLSTYHVHVSAYLLILYIEL